MGYRFTTTEAPVGRSLYVVPTGEWRTRRPVLQADRCRRCGVCMTYCPTGCISKQDGSYAVDLRFCKGCGICAEECRSRAIRFVEEGVDAR